MVRIRRDSLSIVLASRVGFWNAARVLTFIVAWGLMTEREGRPPESIEEYGAYFAQSVRTSYREQALFRKALPGEDNPTRIWGLVRDRVKADPEIGPAQLGSLSVAL